MTSSYMYSLQLPRFKPRGTGNKPWYYGIVNTNAATPHKEKRQSHADKKKHSELDKIRKFGVNWADTEEDTAIKKLENVQRNVLPDICFKDTPLNWPCSAFKLCDVRFKKRAGVYYQV